MYSVTPTSASSDGESRDGVEVSGPWGIQEGAVQLGRKSLWGRGSSMNRPQGERKGLKHWEDKAKALVGLQHTGRVRDAVQKGERLCEDSCQPGERAGGHSMAFTAAVLRPARHPGRRPWF